MIYNDELRAKQSVTKGITFVLLVTATILLVPLLAMQFTDEVAWDLADFAVAGTLLAGTGLTYVIATRKVSSRLHQTVIGTAFAVALFLVWVELAVGIIGS